MASLTARNRLFHDIVPDFRDRPAMENRVRFSYASVPPPTAETDSVTEKKKENQDNPSSGHRDNSEKEKPHARNYTWAQLMARIFALDVLECPRCGGRMRILAAIEDPSVAPKILDYLGLPSRPPPIAPARRNRHFEIAE